MLVLRLLSLFTWLPSIIWLCLHTPLCRSGSIYSACLSLEDRDKKQKGFNRQGRSGFSWQCRPFFFLSPPYSLGFWHIETIEQDKICRERPTISWVIPPSSGGMAVERNVLRDYAVRKYQLWKKKNDKKVSVPPPDQTERNGVFCR